MDQIIALSWDTEAERKAWSAELLKSIRAHKADLDLGNPDAFIPGYVKLSPDQQVTFWAELIISMAKHESNWNPQTKYLEPAPLNIYSVGLLQLSYEDQPAYKLEPLDKEKKSLEDPLVNLRCGVKIMARLVSKDGVVASGTKKQSRGAARYWSVLRTGAKLDQIKARTKKHLGL